MGSLNFRYLRCYKAASILKLEYGPKERFNRKFPKTLSVKLNRPRNSVLPIIIFSFIKTYLYENCDYLPNTRIRVFAGRTLKIRAVEFDLLEKQIIEIRVHEFIRVQEFRLSAFRVNGFCDNGEWGQVESSRSRTLTSTPF